MRTISLEECSQVAGGEGEVMSCPVPPVEWVTVEPYMPDGSFLGFAGEVLRDMTGALRDLGASLGFPGTPIALPVGLAGGLRG